MTAKHAVAFSIIVCCCLILGVSSSVKHGATVTVTDGASLGAALKREDVRIINIRGRSLRWCACTAHATACFLFCTTPCCVSGRMSAQWVPAAKRSMCGSCAGKIRLSKQTWVSEGTVNIRNGRHVILQAGECNLQALSSSQLIRLSELAHSCVSSHNLKLLPL